MIAGLGLLISDMRTLVLVLSGCASFLCASGALAQTDLERAAARDAARSGVAAYESGQYEQAIEALSHAEELVHAPTHRLYLARSQAKAGKLVAARENYLRVMRERLGSDAPPAFVEAQTTAQKEREALDARVPGVTLKIAGAAAKDVSVTMDGAKLPRAMVGLRLPVDPGSHSFRASSPSGESAPVTVTLAEGETKVVVLTLPAPALSGAPGAAPAAGTQPTAAAKTTEPEAPTTDRAQSSGSALRTASYASFGVGALGLGLGSYLLLKSSSVSSDADELYADCKTASSNGRCSDPDAQETIVARDDDAAKQRTFGVVALITGGVGAALGTALLIVDLKRGRTSEQGEVTLAPTIGFRSLGLKGRF